MHCFKGTSAVSRLETGAKGQNRVGLSRSNGEPDMRCGGQSRT